MQRGPTLNLTKDPLNIHFKPFLAIVLHPQVDNIPKRLFPAPVHPLNQDKQSHPNIKPYIRLKDPKTEPKNSPNPYNNKPHKHNQRGALVSVMYADTASIVQAA